MMILKFRIWDPEKKRMEESGSTPSMLSSFFRDTARLNKQLNMDYQQYTGLDKKGNETWRYYDGEGMNLCADDHDEICFEGRDCPLCKMRKDLENKMEALVRELRRELRAIEEIINSPKE